MAREVFKRCEKKYLLTAQQYSSMLEGLEGRMEMDAYSGSSGFTTICNLYYDTLDNYFIRQSIAKPLYKEKLRLRSYGVPQPEDRVFLELKKKYSGTVHKRRSKLTLEDAHLFTQGETLHHPEIANPQVLREIGQLFGRYADLEPRLYLGYDRQALYAVDDPGLRITFDRNIHTRRYDLRLDLGSYGDQLLRDDLVLMEVKAEGGAPLWLTGLLAGCGVFPVGFSKYGAEYQRMLLQQGIRGGDHVCLKPLLTACLAPLSPSVERSLAS